MTEDPDTPSQENGSFGVSQKTIILETLRIAYAAGIGGVVTISIVSGMSFFNVGESGLPASAVTLLPMLGGLLSIALYAYDRHHERDLIIVDFALLIVRPFAVLYRILRTGGR